MLTSGFGTGSAAVVIFTLGGVGVREREGGGKRMKRLGS